MSSFLVRLNILTMFAVFSVAATAGDGDLWIAPVAMVCIATNEGLWNTPMGSALKDAPPFVQAVSKINSKTGAACLKSREWLPPALCSELLAMDPLGKSPLSPIYSRYASDIAGLKDLFGCMENGERASSTGAK